MTIPGLDYAFLRYMQVRRETQREIQKIYLPRFADCHRVVDLGCGDGDFVALLAEQGHEALGVDSDAQEVAYARSANIPVAEADVFDWLTAEADAVEKGERPAWDGVFSAHLVEHLRYERVLDLIRLSYRILRPGGKIILATPNVRGLFSHLEMFYMHFGHETFYHPQLLCFFLEYCGFTGTEIGENLQTGSPLLGLHIKNIREHQSQQVLKQYLATPLDPIRFPDPIRYEHDLPGKRNPLARLWHWGKMFLVRKIVFPFLDPVVKQLNDNLNSLGQINERIAALNANVAQLNAGFSQVDDDLARINIALTQTADGFARMDGAFEVFVAATKPEKKNT